MDYREEFLQIWHQHVSRPGSEKLLDWLDNRPISSRLRPPPGSTGPVTVGCACTA